MTGARRRGAGRRPDIELTITTVRSGDVAMLRVETADRSPSLRYYGLDRR